VHTAPPRTIEDNDLSEVLHHEDVWAIIVWDDPVTTFKQVIDACIVLLGHSRKRAKALADEVDSTGRAVVGYRSRAEAVDIVHGFLTRLVRASIEKA
jgi:ATP-dependent Clp protease adapter protein ClpS